MSDRPGSTSVLDCVLERLVPLCDLVGEQIAHAQRTGNEDLAANLKVILEHAWTLRWEIGLLPEGCSDEDPTRTKAMIVPCPGGVVVVSPPERKAEAS